jgi:DNA mismatch repair protein MutS2
VDKAAAQARTEAVQAIARAQDEALSGAVADLPPEPEAVAAGTLAPGDRVRVRELSIVGDLLALHDQEAEVAVSGKRLRVPRESLLRLEPGRPAPARAAAGWTAQPSAGHGVKSHGHVPAEINLVGLTVDEALPRIDKLLDDASLSERRQIRVIHGFGQGTLRRAVAGLLDGHPHVAAYHLAAANDGGGGVTIVELKE